MGKFTYEGTTSTEFDDRALHHLQMVILAKLRRGESFGMSWNDHPSLGSGRTTIWINPTSNIVFKFYGGRPASINRKWVDTLMLAANSTNGLHLMREPDPGYPVGSPTADAASEAPA